VTCSWPPVSTTETYLPDDSPVFNSSAKFQSAIESGPGIVASSTGPYAFPEARLLHRLLNIFLARHHDVELCSFLHKPSIDIVALSAQSPFLVSSILSLSALYLSDKEANKDFGFESSAALSEHHAQFAKMCAKSLHDEPSGGRSFLNLIN
jgi:hypothetical protein